MNVGLETLKDTVDKVRELRTSLAEKQGQLERKSAEANEKLRRIVADQQETGQKRAASLQVQAELEVQEKVVARPREVVPSDPAKAEPAVIESQRSVGNIKKTHINEVRFMGKPPLAVRLAMESICTLLGHRVDARSTVQSIMGR